MPNYRAPPAPNPPRWQPNPDPSSIAVPGLDTEAPVLDQIEQIEQLITLKLQGIDENFSKIHNVLTNRILPSVRRYAVATKPVRESANFWISFYEKAAQIRIPTVDDYSVTDPTATTEEVSNTEAESSGTQSAEATMRQEDHSVASTETSFMPQAAFASTPAIERMGRSATETFGTDDSELPSWSASLESPVMRLTRGIENYEREESAMGSKLPSLQLDEDDTITRPRVDKGKGKEPLLNNVLRHTLYSRSDDVSFASLSPAKGKGKIKTPVPAKLNPYLPAGTLPANWSGMVDLRKTPLTATPVRKGNLDDDDDDSFDGLPPGMSPPKFMSPARPPRSTKEILLMQGTTTGKTPKEAAASIKNDLVRAATARRYQGESSMSTVSSPPSLSKYNRTDESELDTSLESVMRRVSLNPPTWTPSASTPGLRLKPKPKPPTFSRPPDPEPELPPQFRGTNDDNNNSFDSDSDSLDHGPPAAFIMAAAAAAGPHDSFDSDEDSVSFDAAEQQEAMNMLMGMNGGAGAMLPGGLPMPSYTGDDSFDDSFVAGGAALANDPPQEETVFGRPPVQHGAAGRLSEAGDLLMLGNEPSRLIDTAEFGLIGSPTPAGGAGR
ncbi:hypothetical protein HMN09_00879200 [Mycena chlorophos]|uniref:DASH complex subunit ASK1 n=1 Tax=Mycena chlorophos TaxID=658473 RepID=A0A8H6SN61_MYCCL|nr:hypothetical protein HMN09_00879200 [Mycena chlorophos]